MTVDSAHLMKKQETGAGLMARPVQLLGLLLLVALLSACAASAPTRDEVIPERAQARWDALLAGDFGTAYGYLSPGVRSTMSATDFEIAFRLRRIQYLSAEYREHSCGDDVCTVKMIIGYRVVQPLAGVPEWESESAVEERWILSGGEWWYLPEK